MKKIFIILLVAISFVFFSCKKETVPPKQDTAFASQAETNTGKINPSTDVFTTCFHWGVIGFSINGIDQSSAYSGLDLIFCPDNTFTVSNDLFAESGHWMFEVTPDNTVLLNLAFDSPDVTVESWRNLADVWKVLKLETTAMMLQSTTTEAKTMNLQKWAR